MNSSDSSEPRLSKLQRDLEQERAGNAQLAAQAAMAERLLADSKGLKEEVGARVMACSTL
jgi:hypothetical protein